PVEIAARFLYGAPGADLDGEADATLEVDPQPFAAYRGWHFGLVEEQFKSQVLQFQVPTTDAEGHATIDGHIEPAPSSSLPTKALVAAALSVPGGRSTTRPLSLPLKTKPLLIGIRPNFRDGRVEEDTEAGFQVVALDADGTPVERQ